MVCHILMCCCIFHHVCALLLGQLSKSKASQCGLVSLQLSLPGSARSKASMSGHLSQPVRLELGYFDSWEDPAIHCCFGSPSHQMWPLCFYIFIFN